MLSKSFLLLFFGLFISFYYSAQVPEESLLASNNSKSVDFSDVDLHIYPSPFDETVYVKTSRKIEAIEVLNDSEQTVYFINEGNELNLEKLGSGKYLVRVFFNDGKKEQWIKKR